MPNTVILRGDNFVSREDRCNEAITPGHLLDFAANDRLQKHATALGRAAKMFALESDYNGNSVTTAYVSGDRVPYADCGGGIIVWAHLASGENVVRGAYLSSDGAGRLKAYASGTSFTPPIAHADEDADATVSGTGVNGIRFRARVV